MLIGDVSTAAAQPLAVTPSTIATVASPILQFLALPAVAVGMKPQTDGFGFDFRPLLVGTAAWAIVAYLLFKK